MATTLSKPYVTLDDVKFYCGIGLDDTQHDEDIKKAINKASRLVDKLTGQHFYEQTVTAVYVNTIMGGSAGWSVVNVDRKERIYSATTRNYKQGFIYTPTNLPIISITSITEDDTLLVENTDFYVDYTNGIIEKAGGSWNTSQRSIKITCVLGFDSSGTTVPSDDIPGDIAQHTLEIASRLSGQYKKSIRNYVSGSVEEADLFGVPKDSEIYLKTYRPVRIL